MKNHSSKNHNHRTTYTTIREYLAQLSRPKYHCRDEPEITIEISTSATAAPTPVTKYIPKSFPCTAVNMPDCDRVGLVSDVVHELVEGRDPARLAPQLIHTSKDYIHLPTSNGSCVHTGLRMLHFALSTPIEYPTPHTTRTQILATGYMKKDAAIALTNALGFTYYTPTADGHTEHSGHFKSGLIETINPDGTGHVSVLLCRHEIISTEMLLNSMVAEDQSNVPRASYSIVHDNNGYAYSLRPDLGALATAYVLDLTQHLNLQDLDTAPNHKKTIKQTHNYTQGRKARILTTTDATAIYCQNSSPLSAAAITKKERLDAIAVYAEADTWAANDDDYHRQLISRITYTRPNMSLLRSDLQILANLGPLKMTKSSFMHATRKFYKWPETELVTAYTKTTVLRNTTTGAYILPSGSRQQVVTAQLGDAPILLITETPTAPAISVVDTRGTPVSLDNGLRGSATPRLDAERRRNYAILNNGQQTGTSLTPVAPINDLPEITRWNGHQRLDVPTKGPVSPSVLEAVSKNLRVPGATLIHAASFHDRPEVSAHANSRFITDAAVNAMDNRMISMISKVSRPNERIVVMDVGSKFASWFRNWTERLQRLQLYTPHPLHVHLIASRPNLGEYDATYLSEHVPPPRHGIVYGNLTITYEVITEKWEDICETQRWVDTPLFIRHVDTIYYYRTLHAPNRIRERTYHYAVYNEYHHDFGRLHFLNEGTASWTSSSEIEVRVNGQQASAYRHPSLRAPHAYATHSITHRDWNVTNHTIFYPQGDVDTDAHPGYKQGTPADVCWNDFRTIATKLAMHPAATDRDLRSGLVENDMQSAHTAIALVRLAEKHTAQRTDWTLGSTMDRLSMLAPGRSAFVTTALVITASTGVGGFLLAAAAILSAAYTTYCVYANYLSHTRDTTGFAATYLASRGTQMTNSTPHYTPRDTILGSTLQVVAPAWFLDKRITMKHGRSTKALSQKMATVDNDPNYDLTTDMLLKNTNATDINWANLTTNKKVLKAIVDLENVNYAIAHATQHPITRAKCAIVTGHTFADSTNNQILASYACNHASPLAGIAAMLNRQLAPTAEPNTIRLQQLVALATDTWDRYDFSNYRPGPVNMHTYMLSHPDISPNKKKLYLESWELFLDYCRNGERARFDYGSHRNRRVYAQFPKSGEEGRVWASPNESPAELKARMTNRPRSIGSVNWQYNFLAPINTLLLEMAKHADPAFIYRAHEEDYLNIVTTDPDFTMVYEDFSSYDSSVPHDFMKAREAYWYKKIRPILSQQPWFTEHADRLLNHLFDDRDHILNVTYANTVLLQVTVHGTTPSGGFIETTWGNTMYNVAISRYIYAQRHWTGLITNSLHSVIIAGAGDDSAKRVPTALLNEYKITATDTYAALGLTCKVRKTMSGPSARLDFCSKTTFMDYFGNQVLVRDIQKTFSNSRVYYGSNNDMIRQPQLHSRAVYLSNHTFLNKLNLADTLPGKNTNSTINARAQHIVNHTKEYFYRNIVQDDTPFYGDVIGEIQWFLHWKYETQLPREAIEGLIYAMKAATASTTIEVSGAKTLLGKPQYHFDDSNNRAYTVGRRYGRAYMEYVQTRVKADDGLGTPSNDMIPTGMTGTPTTKFNNMPWGIFGSEKKVAKSGDADNKNALALKTTIQDHLVADHNAGIKHYIPGNIPTASACKRERFTLKTSTTGTASLIVAVSQFNSPTNWVRTASLPTDIDIVGGTLSDKIAAGPISGSTLVTKNFYVNDIYLKVNYVGKLLDSSGVFYAYMTPDFESSTNATTWYNKPHSHIRKVDASTFIMRWKPDDSMSAAHGDRIIDAGIQIYFFATGLPLDTTCLEFELISHFEYVPDDDFRFLVPTSSERLGHAAQNAHNSLRRVEGLDSLAHSGKLLEGIQKTPLGRFDALIKGLISPQQFIADALKSNTGQRIMNTVEAVAPSMNIPIQLLKMFARLPANDSKRPANHLPTQPLRFRSEYTTAPRTAVKSKKQAQAIRRTGNKKPK